MRNEFQCMWLADRWVRLSMAGATWLTLAVLLSACQSATGDVSGAILNDRDNRWEEFLEWWPGEYHNDRQVLEEQHLPESQRRRHTRLVIQRVELPVFGEHVYYAEWQSADDAQVVQRQRIYAFDRLGSTLRLKLHIFPQDKDFEARTVGAYLDPSKLDGVSPSDMAPLAGCDVYFQWKSDWFEGAMKKGDCAFAAPDTGEAVYSWSQMRLQSDSFSYLDGWFRASDGSRYSAAYPNWVTFDRQQTPRAD